MRDTETEALVTMLRNGDLDLKPLFEEWFKSLYVDFEIRNDGYSPTSTLRLGFWGTEKDGKTRDWGNCLHEKDIQLVGRLEKDF